MPPWFAGFHPPRVGSFGSNQIRLGFAQNLREAIQITCTLFILFIILCFGFLFFFFFIYHPFLSVSFFFFSFPFFFFSLFFFLSFVLRFPLNFFFFLFFQLIGQTDIRFIQRFPIWGFKF